MAQPTGQVLVNTGHALAGSLFVYANGTGLWDASAGAMLTKTGTGAVSAEGGANVINSAGTTYFDLGTVITTSAPFSFGFRARTTANNNSSMVAGERTSSNSYIWLNNGSNQLVAKVTGNSGQVAAGATTTMATYWIVRDASNNVSFYKDGVQVTPKRYMPGAFILRNLLAGYTSGTYSLNGAAEFFHFIPSAISAGDVASLSADPYQVLVAAAGVDGNAAGVTLVATASMVAGGVSGGSGSSITVTSPAPYQARQRNKATNTATLSVALTYTGAPTGFEYRFAGGAWAALGGVPSGGSHAATVSLPVGQGAFEVRFANDTGVTASVAGVTVGKVFATAGQSNACGRATAAIAPVAGASGTAVKLGRDAVWKPLTEGLSGSGITYDEGTSAAGSCWGPVSNRLQAQAVPMAFIPVAQGSTSIADWARYDADPSNPYFLYGDLWQAWLAAGGLEGVIYWQGEYEATAGMSQAAYTTPLNTLVNNIWSDFGVETLIVQIVNWVAGAAAIRAAQADVAATNPHAAGLADANVWSGDVHYRTLAEVNAVADVLAPAMVSAFYSTSASASGATLTATASLLPGAASGQRNATASGVVLPASASLLAGAASGAGNAVAGGITLAAVAQLLAGIASGSSASTAPGATLVASAALLPGAASGQASATASGVVWVASASLVVESAENGSIIWPEAPAGEANTARVPFDGVRVIVPDADDPAAPVKLIPLYVADLERVTFDFEAKYLPGAGDTAQALLAVDVPAGLLASATPPVGSALTVGEVLFAIALAPGAGAGIYRMAVQIGTTGGRECTGWLDVQVLDALQPIKTIRLHSLSDRDVIDLNFAAKYLAGAGDTAASLLGVEADAGITAVGRLLPGNSGVAQISVDNPAAPGAYQVRAQLATAGGRRKTAAVAVEVLEP